MLVEERVKVGGWLGIIGTIQSGMIEVGDEIEIDGNSAKVQGIEQHRKTLERAQAGEHVALSVRCLSREQVPVGAVLRKVVR
jgi:translation elongation factor EF-Tu-like GTPase